MPTTYQYGRRWEYHAIQDLKEMGFHAQRTAGSHSPFDIIAWSPNRIVLIQVKKTRNLSLLPALQRLSNSEWAEYAIPHLDGVARQLWIYHNSDLYIYNLNSVTEGDTRP